MVISIFYLQNTTIFYRMECWCGNQQPSKTPKVDDTNCNTPCNGDNKLFCGGGWKMSIYSTGITG